MAAAAHDAAWHSAVPEVNQTSPYSQTTFDAVHGQPCMPTPMPQMSPAADPARMTSTVGHAHAWIQDTGNPFKLPTASAGAPWVQGDHPIFGVSNSSLVMPQQGQYKIFKRSFPHVSVVSKNADFSSHSACLDELYPQNSREYFFEFEYFPWLFCCAKMLNFIRWSLQSHACAGSSPDIAVLLMMLAHLRAGM